jgi:hypothetical protein
MQAGPGGLPELGRAMVGPQRRVAVFVLGMHRSGTSALTRIISLLGADLPRGLMEAGPDNPTGYWESIDVMALNESILSEAGASWDMPSPLQLERAGAALKERFCAPIVEFLRRDFGASALFVIKDPRICRLLPVWHEAAGTFGAEPRFVIIVRNPIEVARSLALRNGMSQPQAMLLWLRHILDAERQTRAKPRAFVTYAELLEDWRGAMARVGRQIAIDWPRPMPEAAAEIDLYLDSDLRHSRAGAGDGLDDIPWVGETWRHLSAMPIDDRSLAPVFDRVAREAAAADALCMPLIESALPSPEAPGPGTREAEALALSRSLLRESAALRTELDARTREVEELRAAASWRLTAPLRGLVQGLRRLRRS